MHYLCTQVFDCDLSLSWEVSVRCRLVPCKQAVFRSYYHILLAELVRDTVETAFFMRHTCIKQLVEQVILNGNVGMAG